MTAFHCEVRWAGECPEGSSELAEEVRHKALAWAGATAELLGREPSAPIVITLRPGPGVSMAKGSQILIPVNANTSVNVAALSHELVHVIAGRSPDHLLNEGLAVHVDDRLRLAGAVWPFYHLAPHRWVAGWRDAGQAAGLGELLATPPFTFSPTDRARYQSSASTSEVRRFYLHAGSVVRFLMAQRTAERFWSDFRAGRILSEDDDAAAIEEAWLDGLGPALSTDERRDAARSMAELGRLRPTVWDPA